MSTSPSFTAFAIPGIPMIQNGDDLPEIIVESATRADQTLQRGDVLVISSKIISKAEGRIVNLAEIVPGDEANTIAQQVDKDPRLVELILHESVGISRLARNVLVTEHRLGFVSANSGVDRSNVGGSDEQAILLPQNPDESARVLRDQLSIMTGHDIAVIISDTHGRPFRLGNVGVAIGVAGLPALLDQRGEHDLFGRELVATIQGYADMIASAAHLLCGEGAEGFPVIVLRGLEHPTGDGRASDLYRPREQDLYR